MIDFANSKGLLDATPEEKMLEIANLQLLAIAALVTAFGATLPAAVQEYINSLNNIPAIPGPPGSGGTTGTGTGVSQLYLSGSRPFTTPMYAS